MDLHPVVSLFALLNFISALLLIFFIVVEHDDLIVMFVILTAFFTVSLLVSAFVLGS